MKPACRSSLEGAGPLGVTWNAMPRGTWRCWGFENSWIKKSVVPCEKGDNVHIFGFFYPPSNIRVTLGNLFFRYNWGNPTSISYKLHFRRQFTTKWKLVLIQMACPTLRLYNLVAKMPDREHIGFSRLEFRWVQFGASRLFWFLAIFTPLQFGQAGLFLTSLTLVFLTKCVSTERFTQP